MKTKKVLNSILLDEVKKRDIYAFFLNDPFLTLHTREYYKRLLRITNARIKVLEGMI